MADATPTSPNALFFYAVDESVFEVCWHEPPAVSPVVPESLVQDIWRLQQFRTHDLRTSDGRRVEVLDPGELNRDGGPDFLGASVRIDGALVRGPVEIHTASTVWYEHGHEQDAAYAGVALHVTLEGDLWTGRLRTSTGRILPEIVLAPRLETPIRTLLYNFYSRPNGLLPCSGQWSSLSDDLVESWLVRLARTRLREKVRLLESRFLERPDLRQLQYELILTGLGYSKNSVPMLELARRVPLALLQRLDSLESMQAALLGTAGLIPDPSAVRGLPRAEMDFVMLLRTRYDDFQAVHRISPMRPTSWQFFRLRPPNFPTVRIAQAAALCSPAHSGPLAVTGDASIRHAIVHGKSASALEKCFRVDPGPFWHANVRLDRPGRRGYPYLGRQRARALFVNAVAPIMLLQADLESDGALRDAIDNFLALLPPEDDEITRIFAAGGWPARSGRDAQALHQLYRTFCRPGGCLTCEIGRALFASRNQSVAPHDRSARATQYPS